VLVDQAFLSRVNHDLRGELATVVAGIHYLQRYEPGLGETGRQMVDRVNGAAQRLRKLLDEMELAAWIDGAPPGLAPEREPCRLDTLAQAALARLGPAVAARGVSVDIAAPEDLAEIEADPELLAAAVEHVLDFAVARSPGRTVRVTCAARELCVADQGGPLEQASLARIFEPFHEKDLVPRPEPGARRRERLGLGLALARGLVLAHGGSLVAASTDAGVEMTLRLG
jgi:signal transduction histidine kinase